MKAALEDSADGLATPVWDTKQAKRMAPTADAQDMLRSIKGFMGKGVEEAKRMAKMLSKVEVRMEQELKLREQELGLCKRELEIHMKEKDTMHQMLVLQTQLFSGLVVKCS